MKNQVSLQYGREPLQIPVPADFTGERSSEESEIFLSTLPCVLTQDEIKLAETHLKALPYKQSLVFGAVFLDENDPLLQHDHAKLNEIEKHANHANTEFVQGGGRRSIYERVLLIRERGYQANGYKQLQQASL